MRDKAYDAVIERVRGMVEPEALAYLNRVAKACIALGAYPDEPRPMHSDDYRWTTTVYPDEGRTDLEHAVDVTVELAEQREYDGGEDYGINFGVDVVGWGGRVYGGHSPYNYTPEVWVDARVEGQVWDRWALLESATPELVAEVATEGIGSERSDE